MAKIGASGQDYLEAILELSDQSGDVRSVDVAKTLKVSRASVNKAMGVLKSEDFIEHEKYSSIKLTPKGVSAAIAVKKRHNLLWDFLNNVLQVSPETAEEDACKMEHVISLETLEKLEGFLEKNK